MYHSMKVYLEQLMYTHHEFELIYLAIILSRTTPQKMQHHDFQYCAENEGQTADHPDIYGLQVPNLWATILTANHHSDHGQEEEGPIEGAFDQCRHRHPENKAAESHNKDGRNVGHDDVVAAQTLQVEGNLELVESVIWNRPCNCWCSKTDPHPQIVNDQYPPSPHGNN